MENKAEKDKVYYLYNGEKDFEVIDMDLIAKQAYKEIKHAKDIANNFVNTADAFLINKENEWYIIEFKDAAISAKSDSLKNNVLKKAYSNWYMLLDVLYSMNEKKDRYMEFAYENPVEFAKQHIHYILVCSEEKNPNIYTQIKNSTMIGEKYTPLFMQRIKDYLFKDAYVYTEKYFERDFVEKFAYE